MGREITPVLLFVEFLQDIQPLTCEADNQVKGSSAILVQAWQHVNTEAYDLAVRFGCSYYDGLYLAAAEMTNGHLLYTDEKLKRNIGHRFALSVWIEDYQARSS